MRHLKYKKYVMTKMKSKFLQMANDHGSIYRYFIYEGLNDRSATSLLYTTYTSLYMLDGWQVTFANLDNRESIVDEDDDLLTLKSRHWEIFL